MKRTSLGKRSWGSLLLIVVALVLWVIEQQGELPGRQGRDTGESGEGGERVKGKPAVNRYEVYRGCSLIPDFHNDGDSFLARLPDGREAVVRLYYVDTPECAFKSYRNGENNHKRIREQAKDLGGITPEQAVAVGKEAKEVVLGRLGQRAFAIHTRWDSPFRDNRYHAFVEVETGSGPRWLHELLVEEGRARVHTKPAELPDGTSVSRQKGRLRELEGKARKRRAGAWGM